jgi:hypothetical protein
MASCRSRGGGKRERNGAGGPAWRTLWRGRGQEGTAHVAVEGEPAPVGCDGGSGCRVAWTGERGGVRGPRVENMGRPGRREMGRA